MDIRKMAALIVSVGFSVYLAKGKLDWIPEWSPILVMVFGGLVFLALDERVRRLAAYYFTTESGKILHPDTRLPITKSEIKVGRTVSMITAVLMLSLAVGVTGWRYRKNNLDQNVENITIVPPQEGWFKFFGTFGSPPNIQGLSAIIRTTPLAKVSGSCYILIVARLEDHSVDPMSDTTIEKSRPFTIVQPEVSINTYPSAGFMQRALPQPDPGNTVTAQITQFLLLIPNDVQPEKISTLKDAKKLNGHILGQATTTIAESARLAPRKRR